MRDIAFRQQFLTTLLLMPLTFLLWYAAGPALTYPATMVAGLALEGWLPSIVAEVFTEGTELYVVTHFADINGSVVAATEADHEIAFKLNTRLVSYGVPFYAALLWSSRVDSLVGRFCLGLFVLWGLMAFGLVAMTAKDLMLVIGDPFLTLGSVPPMPIIGLAYQTSVLLIPSLAPVMVWLFQLRDTPLWRQLADQLESSRSSE
jgi:hypothetical protein